MDNDTRLFYFLGEWRRYRATEAMFAHDPERQQYIRLCQQRAQAALLRTLAEINERLRQCTSSPTRP